MILAKIEKTPIPLSNGLKVGAGLIPEIRGVAEAGGKFSFPIPHPNFGPEDGSWVWATARGTKPGDNARFYRYGWHQAHAVEFASISGLSPWWVRSKEHTHVLRDFQTGTLVGVVEAQATEGNLLWHAIQSAVEAPEVFTQMSRESNKTERGISMVIAELETELYFCLHPCPQGYKDPARQWCFNGTPALRIQRDHSGTWEVPFLAALAEEESRAWEHA